MKLDFNRELRSIGSLRKIRSIWNQARYLRSSPFDYILSHIANHKIETLLDVGANIGQFGIDMRLAGFREQIVSFEPGRAAFDQLTKNAQKYQPWRAFNVGLGSTETSKFLNISGNDGLSSSLLTMETIHLQSFPKSQTIGVEEVQLSTLDKQFQILKLNPLNTLLKIDVQGYEMEVLRGAKNTLSEIPFCYLEISLIPLYKEEVTFLPMLNFLLDSGHSMIDIFRGIESNTGRLLQVDVLTKNRFQ